MMASKAKTLEQHPPNMSSTVLMGPKASIIFPNPQSLARYLDVALIVNKRDAVW